MKKKLGIAAVTATLASLALAGTASADAASPVSTDHLSFGDQTVGTSSAPQTVTLNVPCYYVLDLRPYGGIHCSAPGQISAIEKVGDDFTMSHDCQLPIYNDSIDGEVVTCTVTVGFSPAADGARTGVINFAAYGDSDAYTVALDGNGVVPSSGGGSTPGGTADGKAGTSGEGGSNGVTAKKCKKSKKGAKAKKCKKVRR